MTSDDGVRPGKESYYYTLWLTTDGVSGRIKQEEIMLYIYTHTYKTVLSGYPLHAWGSVMVEALLY